MPEQKYIRMSFSIGRYQEIYKGFQIEAIEVYYSDTECTKRK